MSEWIWKIWCIGWARLNNGRQIIDMGNTHYLVWRRVFGRLYVKVRTVPHGGRFWNAIQDGVMMAKINISDNSALFICPGCMQTHRIPFGKGSGPRWTFNGDVNKPTFSPSLRIRWTYGEEGKPGVCHSFITDGQIHFLSDCTHSLAGQTVDLLDVEINNEHS